MCQLGSVPIGVEKELKKEHENCLKMQEHYWYQRLRVNWATLGDRNSRFFHAMAITRKRRNTVRALQSDTDDWLTTEKEIRTIFVQHFKAIYQA